MTRDDDFEPKLGRIRSRRGRSYLHRVLRAVALAGGRPRGGSSSRRSTFHGSQLGRGASIGRLLSSRDRHAAFRSRRVVVKYRSVKLAGKGLKAARGHLRYVQRDGVTREGLPGRARERPESTQPRRSRAEDLIPEAVFPAAVPPAALRTMAAIPPIGVGSQQRTVLGQLWESRHSLILPRRDQCQ
jgi:hypothetical protein